MNTTAVLIFSALNLGLQVKIGSQVYLLQNDELFRLEHHSVENEGGLKLTQHKIKMPLSLSQFLALTKTITHDELVAIHDHLSQRGALAHA